MTSIAEAGSPQRGRAGFRALLLLGALGVMATGFPLPWGGLWLVVPAAVAASLLLSWRFGPRGALLPALLLGGAMIVARPLGWAWWAPFAALSGVWMGMREEGGGPGAGERAWMLLPVLLLAAALPWVRYPELVARVDSLWRAADREFLTLWHQSGENAARLRSLERTLAEGATLRTQLLPYVLPTLLFVWVALLVVAGRSLAACFAGLLRWPPLSRARLADWRLPDVAVWTVIAGAGLLATMGPKWAPTGWTLLINSSLGYCVQGIAVVESLLLARGVSPSVIVLTLLFVFTLATPLFVMAATFVGLSDVWLDYRRLEPTPDGEES